MRCNTHSELLQYPHASITQYDYFPLVKCPILGLLYLMASWVLPLLRYLCCGKLFLHEILLVNWKLNGSLRALSAPCMPSPPAAQKLPRDFQGAKSEIHCSISMFLSFHVNKQWVKRHGKLSLFEETKRKWKVRNKA